MAIHLARVVRENALVSVLSVEHATRSQASVSAQGGTLVRPVKRPNAQETALAVGCVTCMLGSVVALQDSQIRIVAPKGALTTVTTKEAVLEMLAALSASVSIHSLAGHAPCEGAQRTVQTMEFATS